MFPSYKLCYVKCYLKGLSYNITMDWIELYEVIGKLDTLASALSSFV